MIIRRPDFIPEDEWTYIFDYVANDFAMDYRRFSSDPVGFITNPEPILEEKFHSKFEWHFGLTLECNKLKQLVLSEFRERDFFQEQSTKFSGITYQITDQAQSYVDQRNVDESSCLHESQKNTREIVRTGFFNILAKYTDDVFPDAYEFIEYDPSNLSAEPERRENTDKLDNSAIPAADRYVSKNHNAWNEPDYEGAIGPEAEEEVRSLIRNAIDELPRTGLSNSDQSQAMANLEAADKLANAPVPQWRKVREILEPMSQVAGIGSLIVAIISLLVAIS